MGSEGISGGDASAEVTYDDCKEGSGVESAHDGTATLKVGEYVVEDMSLETASGS
jgi:hypothetical protein